MPNPEGRPPLWTDPKVIEAQAEVYFAKCMSKNLPMTITGLALALGTWRSVLMDYEEKDEFSATIKRIKARCENYAEQQMFAGRNQAGAIFALKNYGWRDKQEIDHTNDGGKFEQAPMSPAATAATKVYEQSMKKAILG